MKLLSSKNTIKKSDQQVGKPGLGKQRRVLVRKPGLLRSKDGKIIKVIKRTKAECIEDFWKRVDIKEPDKCWEWLGGKNGNGKLKNYGVMWCRGNKQRAHRFAYSIKKGKIPKWAYICHHCDNPKCVNPLHLFIGTPKENAQDCLRKGRAYREKGEDRYNAKLTEQDIKDIRNARRKKNPESLAKIGRKYGVGATMIHNIEHKRRWRHII